MKNSYITASNPSNLIEEVIVRKLVIHKDDSGILVETLRTDWGEVYADNPFAMQYMSVTPSGLIRDEDKWHVHKKQIDRFVCVSGKIVTALFDPREGSKTKGILNLFLMGPEKEEEMYMLLIPKDVFHGFAVVSKEQASLLNFPTQLYTGDDEGRVENKELNWREILNDFGI